MARCARHAGCGHGSCGYSGFTCSRGGNPPAMCGSPEGHVHPASPVTRAVALDSPLPGRGGRAEDAKQNRRSVVMPAVSSRHCHPFRRRRCLLPVPPAGPPLLPVPPPAGPHPCRRRHLPHPSTLLAAAAACCLCHLLVRPCQCRSRLRVPTPACAILPRHSTLPAAACWSKLEVLEEALIAPLAPLDGLGNTGHARQVFRRRVTKTNIRKKK